MMKNLNKYLTLSDVLESIEISSMEWYDLEIKFRLRLDNPVSIDPFKLRLDMSKALISNISEEVLMDIEVNLRLAFED